jgi:hypothetical protein
MTEGGPTPPIGPPDEAAPAPTAHELSWDLTTAEPLAPPRPLVESAFVIRHGSAMEDWARLSIALVLVGLLVVLTLGAGIVVAVSSKPNIEPEVESFLKFVFTPVVGLVGSVVGFYFGSRTKSDAPRG